MWDHRYLTRIDFRILPVIIALMFSSLLVIGANEPVDDTARSWMTPMMWSQFRAYILGFAAFAFFASFDYNKLREWTWILYFLSLLALLGLFFVDSVQNVNRWYRLPFLKIAFQPSEYAKIIVIMALAWVLERRRDHADTIGTLLTAGLVVFVPFVLILKQPDLGTALILYPITLVCFYIADVKPFAVKCMTFALVGGLAIVASIFLDIIPHEELRPYATQVIKDYQFERLNPHTRHQESALTAISMGGVTGSGWRQGTYAIHGWLPAAQTDSVFPAFGEQFGLLGLLGLLALFCTLISFSFRVAVVAKDPFGRLLAAGIATSLAMHIFLNMGMMTGFLPITGVPLLLVTYGGSSVLATMVALGILQSIYSRRFMF